MNTINLNQFGFIVGGTYSSTPNEKFVWVKRTGANSVPIWEKVSSEGTKMEGNLGKIKVELAQKFKFEDKEKWFKCQTDKLRIPWTYGADHLYISENNLLETTLQGIKKINLHKEVKIVFEEEKKVNDAGGLMREFIHLICLEIFKTENDLFSKTETQEMIYKINPKCPDTKENHEMYKLIGKIVGKAMFEQITVPIQLDRFLLKQIIKQDFDLEDLATVDKPLYNSLKYIQENSINGSDIFEEYFVTPSPLDGSQIELVTNGAQVQITDENKDDFIKLQLEWIGKKLILKKVQAFLSGLHQVIPEETLQVYTVEELEMKMNGLPFIDLGDWEANSVYKGLYNKSHQVIKWFWEVMKELDQEQLSKFFHFCTGSTRLPVEGFRVLQSNRGEFQKFTIESVRYSKESSGLKSHTCFNRLELPNYPKKEILKEKLMEILRADFIGVFGIE